jgi:hypothetical protein
MISDYKIQILAWIEEAENKAVSDIDFLDIVGKLLYTGYPKMRFSLLKEMIVDNKQTYIPTENGITETTDVVFTVNEIKEFLYFLKESYELHKWNDLPRAEDIKKYHNDLIDNVEMGGCWDKIPEYIKD